MNKGTFEGTEEEINFVKELNLNKPSKYWNIFNFPYSTKELFAIHVTEHKFGKINNARVKPKADIFIAKGIVDDKIIKEKEGYLNEEDAQKYKLEPIKKTGVSIKRIDSDKYQILKMNPITFKKIFGNYELGAGASIYCLREEELEKNDSVLAGWNTDWKKMGKFFKTNKTDISECKKIKNASNDLIHKKIEEDKSISDFVFKGEGNFEEPFTATWFYEKGELKLATKIPFNVTTGSGRSHGDFTIVIKPKN